MDVTPLSNNIIYATDDHDGYGAEEIIPVRLENLLLAISKRGKENYLYCRDFPRRLVVKQVAAAHFIRDMQAAMPALFETRLADDATSRVLVNTDSIDWGRMAPDMYLIRSDYDFISETRFLDEDQIRVRRMDEPLRRQIRLDNAEWIKMCRHAGSPVPCGECYDGSSIKDRVEAIIQTESRGGNYGPCWKVTLTGDGDPNLRSRIINENLAAEILGRGNFSLLRAWKMRNEDKDRIRYWAWVNRDLLAADQESSFAVAYRYENNELLPNQLRYLAMQEKNSIRLSFICADTDDVRRMMQGKQLPETVLKAWGTGTDGRVLVDTAEELPCHNAADLLMKTVGAAAQDTDGTAYNIETLVYAMTLHHGGYYAAKGSRCRIVQHATKNGKPWPVESFVSEGVFRQMTGTSPRPDKEQEKLTPVKVYAVYPHGDFCPPEHLLALAKYNQGYRPIDAIGMPMCPVNNTQAAKLINAPGTDWKKAGRGKDDGALLVNLACAYSGKILTRLYNTEGREGGFLVNIAGDAVVDPFVFYYTDPELVDKLNKEAEKYAKSR